MRYELGDYEWATIKRTLPNKPRGISAAANSNTNSHVRPRS